MNSRRLGLLAETQRHILRDGRPSTSSACLGCFAMGMYKLKVRVQYFAWTWSLVNPSTRTNSGQALRHEVSKISRIIQAVDALKMGEGGTYITADPIRQIFLNSLPKDAWLCTIISQLHYNSWLAAFTANFLTVKCKTIEISEKVLFHPI